MKQIIAAFVLVSALALGSARADAGYPCTVRYDPRPSTDGNLGYLTVTLYSGPGCTGTFQGVGGFCSEGATDAFCTATYLPLAFERLAQNLIEAATREIRIEIDGGQGESYTAVSYQSY